MDEGMPWRIIMIFFAIGVYLGIKGEKKAKKKAEENIQESTE
jgi:hypothetical protein